MGMRCCRWEAILDRVLTRAQRALAMLCFVFNGQPLWPQQFEQRLQKLGAAMNRLNLATPQCRLACRSGGHSRRHSSCQSHRIEPSLPPREPGCVSHWGYLEPTILSIPHPRLRSTHPLPSGISPSPRIPQKRARKRASFGSSAPGKLPIHLEGQACSMTWLFRLEG